MEMSGIGRLVEEVGSKRWYIGKRRVEIVV